MRLATLGINFGWALASFALGLGLGLSPRSAVSNAPEREFVSGAATREAPAAAPLATEPPATEPPKLVIASSKPIAADAEPTWRQVAARAQTWTSAIRADLNYGAGLIVDPRGLILTNLHVVANARSITVTPFGNNRSSARVIDTDADLDLALLSADFPTPLPAAATLGSAADLTVGDEVLAVGSPRKMYFSVSRGMVSFPNRLMEGVEYIQTDLPINEGNSGGPLIDRAGRVIGIVSFILKESQGLSFALPIDRALARFAPYLAGQPAPSAGKTAVGKLEAGKQAKALGGSPGAEPPRRAR